MRSLEISGASDASRPPLSAMACSTVMPGRNGKAPGVETAPTT